MFFFFFFIFSFWQGISSDMPEVWWDKWFSRQKQKEKAGICLQKMVPPIDFCKNAWLSFQKEKPKSDNEIAAKSNSGILNNHLKKPHVALKPLAKTEHMIKIFWFRTWAIFCRNFLQLETQNRWYLVATALQSETSLTPEESHWGTDNYSSLITGRPSSLNTNNNPNKPAWTPLFYLCWRIRRAVNTAKRWKL